MRTGSGIFATVVVLLALTISACGSSTPPKPNLFREYARSTSVQSDRFPSGGDVSSADRLANFAAYYTPEQLLAELLSAFPCDSAPDNADCDLDGAVTEAIDEVAKPDEQVFGRTILVKHANGSLELITLYVVTKSDTSGDSAALIDATGGTYTAGLDDFRQNNDLLGSDDWILAPRNITAVPGKGKIVTVSGHTAVNQLPWLITGFAVVIVLIAGIVVSRRRTARRARAAE